MKVVINNHNNLDNNSLSKHLMYVRYYMKHFTCIMIFNIQNDFENSYYFNLQSSILSQISCEVNSRTCSQLPVSTKVHAPNSLLWWLRVTQIFPVVIVSMILFTGSRSYRQAMVFRKARDDFSIHTCPKSRAELDRITTAKKLLLKQREWETSRSSQSILILKHSWGWVRFCQREK